jgi:putative addiction module killer protein
VSEIIASSEFDRWLGGLRDRHARVRIVARLVRLEAGNPGDISPVGDGLTEMRLHFGPGYRVYYMARGETLIILLAGGDKSTQASDITKAKSIAKAWE